MSRHAAALLVVVLVVSGLKGCATTSGRTTALRGADVLEASDALREDLVQSDFLASRSRQSAPARLGFGPIQNRSNERVTEGDRRVVVARAVIRQDMLDHLASKNMAVVLPPANADELARLGVPLAEHLASYQVPTHVIEGSLRSATRGGASGRSTLRNTRADLFVFDLAIVELDTRRTVWSGTHELARAARGTLVD